MLELEKIVKSEWDNVFNRIANVYAILSARYMIYHALKVFLGTIFNILSFTNILIHFDTPRLNGLKLVQGGAGTPLCTLSLPYHKNCRVSKYGNGGVLCV